MKSVVTERTTLGSTAMMMTLILEMGVRKLALKSLDIPAVEEELRVQMSALKIAETVSRWASTNAMMEITTMAMVAIVHASSRLGGTATR